MGQTSESIKYSGERKGTPRPNGVKYIQMEVESPKLQEWANADYEVVDYDSGEHIYNGGSRYYYEAGKTLRINGEPVMDTSERPWCQKTIRMLFEGVKGARTDYRRDYEAPRVLELGYGLGMTSSEILRGLDGGMVTPGPRGGEYIVVELNEKLARFAHDTIGKRMKNLRALDGGESKDKIDATVIQGDAYDALGMLTNEIREGKRKPFDAIISDLYDPGQSDGTTDLRRLDLMRDALADGGFFSFFVYHRDSLGSGTNRVQEELLDQHGFSIKSDTVMVNPNPAYEYLFQPNKEGVLTPVRRLTTVVAWQEPGNSREKTYSGK